MGSQSQSLGAIEGFYGQPYSEQARLELIGYLGEIGATDYAYAPKGDPWQRDQWREPYPPERLEHFRALLAAGEKAGVRVGFVISPGLDWVGGEVDEAALVAKLRAFHDLGARTLAIAFDDVAPGGADLGATHAAAVAHAVAELPDDISWSTCPVDYSAPTSTDYLAAFVAGLPEQVTITWTGPGIVAPRIEAADLAVFASSLGLSEQRVVIADNFPVNDGPMAGVLHLGPYPHRDPGLTTRCAGLLLNLMPGHPLASRIGLRAAVTWWQQPERDREEIWLEVLASVPGIEPLARASRSWLLEPGPDQLLLDMELGELGEWLARGCREGLAPEWVAELEPWLQAWEWEAFAMAFVGQAGFAAAMDPAKRTEAAFGVAEAMRLLRSQTHQLFGIRFAVYPVTRLEDQTVLPDPSGVVQGDNLTDLLCRRALAVAYGEQL